jgi:hypothetical protein
MSLENKTLPELVERKGELIRQIASDPVHSGTEYVEFLDVKDRIELRMREAQRKALGLDLS